ncbi:erythrocyte membrane protein 1, PfEMP1, putative [Plasmodium gaboni]|uniref:Erythrocyte membrane protein 1, PfEMP1, putative n=1 Tax=Plasmodium gaboni TaxID=647221 RepID=A0ABY1UW73_9APIC|nr:erythrocyte membrane protein 1, PfEMP1, putative [Plasmodium gaboni]
MKYSSTIHLNVNVIVCLFLKILIVMIPIGKKNTPMKQIVDDDTLKCKYDCKKLLHIYDYWLHNRKVEWKNLSDKYKHDKSTNQKYKALPPKAQNYIYSKCPEYDCTFKELQKLYDENKDEQQLIKSLVQKNTINQTRDTQGQKNK